MSKPYMTAVELLEGTDNCPNKVFSAPGLIVEGWKQAQPVEARFNRRVLRLRRGGERLTTKVSIC